MKPELDFFDIEPVEDERPVNKTFEANYYVNHQEEIKAFEKYILHGDWLGGRR